MPAAHHCLNCFTPPHLLRKLLESKEADIREHALNTLLATAGLRGERAVRSSFAEAAPGNGRRTIFDCRGDTDLALATTVRPEDGPSSADETVNRAFDGLGITREFYQAVFERNSIDDRGMRLDGYVHFDTNYNNAGWDGQRMIFGDGDGRVFTDFTKSLDVIGHELAHGVTQFTAGLVYRGQPGALNESMSDVFGSLIKQWSLNQSAEDADWLVGAEIFTPGIPADSLRSMKSPGKAYDNDLMGRDPQPDHMSKFVQTNRDNGGVHINSGIPNRAFYLAAINIGGSAWGAPGRIWYESLRASTPSTQFQEFADTTYLKAGQMFGSNSSQQLAVLEAWREVGIRISGVVPEAGRSRGKPAGGRAREEDTPSSLAKQMEALSAQVKALAKEVEALKGRR